MKKETQEKMNRLSELYGAKTGTLEINSCKGKWAGTYDLSVVFDNGERRFISNGMKKFTDNLNKEIGYISAFLEKKEDVMRVLHEMEEQDNALAKERGLLTYHVTDVKYITKGDWLGWFYAELEMSDGQKTTIQETGLKWGIKNMVLPDAGDLSKTDENALKKNMSSIYYTASGVSDNDVQYIFHGTGFSIGSYSAHVA